MGETVLIPFRSGPTVSDDHGVERDLGLALLERVESAEGDRLLSTQRARDREAKDMLALMHGAPIDPPCPHACGEAEAPKVSAAQTLRVDELVVYEEY